MIKFLESVDVDVAFFSNGTDIELEEIERRIRFTIDHSFFRKMFSIWDIEKERVVCFLGLNYIATGVYEIWIARSTCIKEYLTIFSSIKAFLKSMIEENMVHRFQATVYEKDLRYIKFLKFLGLKFEGICHNLYNDGRSFVLLAGGI